MIEVVEAGSARRVGAGIAVFAMDITFELPEQDFPDSPRTS